MRLSGGNVRFSRDEESYQSRYALSAMLGQPAYTQRQFPTRSIPVIRISNRYPILLQPGHRVAAPSLSILAPLVRLSKDILVTGAMQLSLLTTEPVRHSRMEVYCRFKCIQTNHAFIYILQFCMSPHAIYMILQVVRELGRRFFRLPEDDSARSIPSRPPVRPDSCHLLRVCVLLQHATAPL